MAETSEFPAPARSTRWAKILFYLCLTVIAWFTVVLYGEHLAWTSDPGAWAGVPTLTWAWIALAVFALTAVLYIALLARREISQRTYTLGEGAPLPAAAMGPSDADPSEADAVLAELEEPRKIK